MNLNVNNWRPFFLGDIFDIKKGKRLTSEDQEDGVYNYIGAIDSNNGVANHIAQKPIHDGNTISLSYNGSVGEAFYQNKPYWATDDVNALYCRYEGFNTHKYSEKGYIPDWQFMEDYIKSLHYKPITTKNICRNTINIKEWQYFVFGRLIEEPYKAYAYTKEELEEADKTSDFSIRYITRTSENNGCELIVKSDGLGHIENGNAISIGDTTATCFYQEEKFVTGDHMMVIRADWLNKYTGLFIVTLLNFEQYRYSYGRAFLMDRVKETIVKLPIMRNNDGSPIIDESRKFSDKGYIPDWQFMENYIKSLPYGDRI